MILKHFGESGDDRSPPEFRDEKIGVFAKHGAIGWIILSINYETTESSKTPSFVYPVKSTRYGNQQGHLIKGEFHRRLLDCTDFSGDISSLSEYEIDDMLSQSYEFVANHHIDDWSIRFSENGKWRDDKKLKGIKRVASWLRSVMQFEAGISTVHGLYVVASLDLNRNTK